MQITKALTNEDEEKKCFLKTLCCLHWYNKMEHKKIPHCRKQSQNINSPKTQFKNRRMREDRYPQHTNT